LTSCSPEFNGPYDEYGVGYDEYGEVAAIRFDASGESAEVTIPDEHDGKPVTDLSSNIFGCRYIAYGDDIVNSYRGIYDDVDETRVFALTLNIGKNVCTNVSDCTYREFFKRDKDGRLINYKVNIYVNCSEENEIFISEDGILYCRSEYESGIFRPIIDSNVEID